MLVDEKSCLEAQQRFEARMCSGTLLCGEHGL